MTLTTCILSNVDPTNVAARCAKHLKLSEALLLPRFCAYTHFFFTLYYPNLSLPTFELCCTTRSGSACFVVRNPIGDGCPLRGFSFYLTYLLNKNPNNKRLKNGKVECNRGKRNKGIVILFVFCLHLRGIM